MEYFHMRIKMDLRAIALAVFTALVLAGTAVAQDPLYMPRAVHNAYTKGTRSMDGRPGPNYWQNHGRYAITFTASPPSRVIRGTEQVTYINNSPDSLRNLIFRL